MNKLNLAIIGSGKVGCDFLVKVLKLPYINVQLLAGRNEDSPAKEFAKNLGIKYSSKGIDAILKIEDELDILVDATNSESNIEHVKALTNKNLYLINMTPSGVGFPFVPFVNENYSNERIFNLISCGAQSAIPILNLLQQKDYIEIASTLPSNSTGIGTRENISEYILTTEKFVSVITECSNVKTILTLNPSTIKHPMRLVLFAKSSSEFDIVLLNQGLVDTIKQIHRYMPGYKVTRYWEKVKNYITSEFEIWGNGDYLSIYDGNLDIITSVGISICQMIYEK